jgi:hypothetical protein
VSTFKKITLALFYRFIAALILYWDTSFGRRNSAGTYIRRYVHLRIKISAHMSAEILVQKFKGQKGISAVPLPWHLFKIGKQSVSVRKKLSAIYWTYWHTYKHESSRFLLFIHAYIHTYIGTFDVYSSLQENAFRRPRYRCSETRVTSFQSLCTSWSWHLWKRVQLKTGFFPSRKLEEKSGSSRPLIHVSWVLYRTT